MELLDQINEIVAIASAIIGYIVGIFKKRKDEKDKNPPNKPIFS